MVGWVGVEPTMGFLRRIMSPLPATNTASSPHKRESIAREHPQTSFPCARFYPSRLKRERGGKAPCHFFIRTGFKRRWIKDARTFLAVPLTHYESSALTN